MVYRRSQEQPRLWGEGTGGPEIPPRGAAEIRQAGRWTGGAITHIESQLCEKDAQGLGQFAAGKLDLSTGWVGTWVQECSGGWYVVEGGSVLHVPSACSAPGRKPLFVCAPRILHKPSRPSSRKPSRTLWLPNTARYPSQDHTAAPSGDISPSINRALP